MQKAKKQQRVTARKRQPLIRLNNIGVHHAVVPVLSFAALFGIIGVFLLMSSQAATPSVDWIMDAHAISLIQGAGASNTLISRAFTTSNTYTLNPVSGSPGTETADYKSYAQLVTDFANKTLPGSYKAVLYDNEDWSYTPTSEQQNPNLYEEDAANLVHQHKMTFITAPAADIVNATGKLVNNSVYQTYLSRNIAGGAAKYADIFEIQAQNDQEISPSTFSSFVQSAVIQARAANPKVKILVGLSTNPGGTNVTGQQLYVDYVAVHSLVNGFWLNIPGASTTCPACGTPYPQAGYYVLQQIYGIK